jgi:hypothetical protein
MEPTAPLHRTSAGLLVRLWRGFKVCAVTLFVVWNLFFLLCRNPLDLWWDDYLKKWCVGKDWWPEVEGPFKQVDQATYNYGAFFGLDQGWTMFTPEMARRSPFVAARLEFTDDSSLMLYSENEPENLNHFFRFGGWRQRKLEDRLTSWNRRNRLPDTEELPLWETYVRWSIRRWHKKYPDDERIVERVVLLDRRIKFPKPGTDPRRFDEPKVTVVAVFDPEGRFLSKPEDE